MHSNIWSVVNMPSYNETFIFHTNNYLATVQDKNEVVILIIMPVSVLLNIILLVIVGVKYCKDKEKRKIQGEYAWF